MSDPKQQKGQGKTSIEGSSSINVEGTRWDPIKRCFRFTKCFVKGATQSVSCAVVN
jgi:hypothetical protein